MNITCKTCGSHDVVVACDRIMSPNDGCVFLCLKCRAAFMEPVAGTRRELESETEGLL